MSLPREQGGSMFKGMKRKLFPAVNIKGPHLWHRTLDMLWPLIGVSSLVYRLRHAVRNHRVSWRLLCVFKLTEPTILTGPQYYVSGIKVRSARPLQHAAAEVHLQRGHCKLEHSSWGAANVHTDSCSLNHTAAAWSFPLQTEMAACRYAQNNQTVLKRLCLLG